MAKSGDRNVILKAIDWAYDKALQGIPGFDSAIELADSYRQEPGRLDERVRRLVKWQVAKAGTSGFITGLGGVLLMPLTIPADLGSVLFLQTRMIAAIAHMAGYDVHSDQVRTLAYVCLCGNASKDVLKNVGIQAGTLFAKQSIKGISGKALVSINQKVGFRLVTKFGEKGVINLGKALPLVGGLIGGAFDSVGTHAVGTAARTLFVGDDARDPAPKAAAAE